MSINFHIYGNRKIKILATGVIEEQNIYFNCWQTPTDITKALIKSDDPIDAYKKWISSKIVDEQEPIYNIDDIFCDGPIIGYTVINRGNEHIKSLEQWQFDCEKAGYTISWEAW